MPATHRTAAQIRQDFTDQVNTIRGRRDLSTDGRRRQIAKARTEADTAMRALRDAHTAARADQEATLVSRLFRNAAASNPTAVVSYRDAQDRAERLTKPDDAADLLGRARRSGDALLAQAVAERAYDRITASPRRSDRWAAVLNQWAEHEPPDVDDTLTQLGQLHRAGTDLFAYSLPTPAELDGVNTTLLARQADRTPGEDTPPDPLAGFGFQPTAAHAG